MTHPKVLLIGGNRGRWTWQDRLHDARYDNGIEAWVHATQGTHVDHASVTLDDVNRADVVICNTNGLFKPKEAMRYIRLAEQRRSGVLWVSLLEGDMRDYMRPHDLVRRAFDASDLVNCINRHATDAIQGLTTTPVRYIGIPYPVEGVRSQATPIAERLCRVYICAFLMKRWNDAIVARQLGIPVDGYHVRMHRRLSELHRNWKRYGTIFDKSAPATIARSMYRDMDLTARPESRMAEYYAAMGRNMLWINMDERYTWARYVLDAAALGVPIITTQSTGHGDVLFPDTTVATPFDVVDAVRRSRRLLDDVDHYCHVSAHAQELIWQYDAPKVVSALYAELGI
ncbi:MAG: hypothetical protein FGM32_04980 [Candidatus Kapabacteria bacterium]|nr:hypothetical protein [Candidatus Kapabacteria bacterium]